MTILLAWAEQIMWDKDGAVQIGTNGTEFQYKGNGVGFVWAKQMLTPEHPYFEVVFGKSSNIIPNVSIGLSGANFGRGGMVGQVPQSLGFCNKDGTLGFGQGSGVPVSSTMDRIRFDDRIGIGVVFDNQKVAKSVYYLKNGSMLARHALLEGESARLYPVVACAETAEVKLFMPAESPLETVSREDIRWACTLNKETRVLDVESALQQLRQGDQLEVHGGVHVLRNNLTICTACTLTGVSKDSNKPTVVGTNGDLFTVDSGDDHVTFRSICIKSFDKRNVVTQQTQRPRACILLKSGSISIESCDLYSCGAAFVQQDNKSIQQVKITSCTIRNIDKLTYGMHLGETKGCTVIDNCQIDGSVTGIYCGRRSHVSIRNLCKITNCGTGVKAMYVIRVEMDACTLSRCQAAGVQHDTQHETGQEDSEIIVRGTTIEYCPKQSLHALGEHSRIYYDDKVVFDNSPLPDCSDHRIKLSGGQGGRQNVQVSKPRPLGQQVSGAAFEKMRGLSVEEVYRMLTRCGAGAAAKNALENQTDGDTFVRLSCRLLRDLGMAEVSARCADLCPVHSLVIIVIFS